MLFLRTASRLPGHLIPIVSISGSRSVEAAAWSATPKSRNSIRKGTCKRRSVGSRDCSAKRFVGSCEQTNFRNAQRRRGNRVAWIVSVRTWRGGGRRGVTTLLNYGAKFRATAIPAVAAWWRTSLPAFVRPERSTSAKWQCRRRRS